MKKILDITLESIKMVFSQHIDVLKMLYGYRERLFNIILTSLQLWCLNLSFYFTWLIMLPLMIKWGYIFDNIIKFTQFYFVDGLQFHLWLLMVCFIFVLCNLDEL